MSELLKINVNEHTEKKGALSYLSWAWAWAEVLKHDPKATWALVSYDLPDGTRTPCMWIGDTALVVTRVTINGIERVCHLPVMDNRNNAVKNPDARKISDAIMRCMTKAVAMHGLGLYIYAGEDLPQADDDSLVPVPEASIAAAKSKKTGAMADALRDAAPLDKYQTEYMDELAAEVSDVFVKKGQAIAFDRVEIENLDNDQKLHLWSRLDSKVRSALKVERGLRVGAA